MKKPPGKNSRKAIHIAISEETAWKLKELSMFFGMETNRVVKKLVDEKFEYIANVTRIVHK